jgi:hypothetical protein
MGAIAIGLASFWRRSSVVAAFEIEVSSCVIDDVSRLGFRFLRHRKFRLKMVANIFGARNWNGGVYPRRRGD